MKAVRDGGAAGGAPDVDGPVVVGVGASAGGLDALERFLRSLAPDPALAFVIVQHQDPSRHSELPALLQRATPLPVSTLAAGEEVQPGHVYVAPAGRQVSLLRGRFELFDQEPARPRSQPIDFFFRALAAERRERSVGIVLSGMGSDGALGVAAIDAAGGLVLVQEPSTAQFDGMPRSAIATGLAGLVDAPEGLARALPAKLEGPRPSVGAGARAEHLEAIAGLLRAHTGRDVSGYKQSVLSRRIERRMSALHSAGLEDYVRLARERPSELDLLLRELLIGVTRFFRDPEAWAALEDAVVPPLLRGRAQGRSVRVWCVGCSTGEEAYSLAMLFADAIGRLEPSKRVPVRIFATDLDAEAIERARRGVYPEAIAEAVGEARLRRFFAREDGGGYRVGREIRDMLTFAVHDVLSDPPFTRLDLVSCRNVLIYLDPAAQRAVLPLLHFALEPHGALLLGPAESLSVEDPPFTPLDARWRLFTKGIARAAPRLRLGVRGPPQAGAAASPAPARAPETLQGAVEGLLLRRVCPAAVVVAPDGAILYAHGSTGRFLSPAVGRAVPNLFTMIRGGLRDALERIFPRVAARRRGTTIVRGLTVAGVPGRRITMTIHAVEAPRRLEGTVLVAFALAGKRRKAARRTSTEGAEPRRLRRLVTTLREEMRGSGERLTCANEELQSTNEELQSTNEELSSSSEELQSLNEELQTINAELQAKVEEASRTSNDLRNLLNATEIATLFLDGALAVRSFTPSAARLFNLRPTDAGRPITDLASNLIHPSLAEDVTAVLRELATAERDVKTVDGRWFRVRMMPYRSSENVVDGAVLTFLQVTAAKRLEEEVAELRRRLEGRA